ncbi:hypothetical protein CIB48_g107 [Xylaria polymorpha]|nr:hypothetical protein CIB48_g107 [Xylaria polymorpha]
MPLLLIAVVIGDALTATSTAMRYTNVRAPSSTPLLSSLARFEKIPATYMNPATLRTGACGADGPTVTPDPPHFNQFKNHRLECDMRGLRPIGNKKRRTTRSRKLYACRSRDAPSPLLTSTPFTRVEISRKHSLEPYCDKGLPLGPVPSAFDLPHLGLPPIRNRNTSPVIITD